MVKNKKCFKCLETKPLSSYYKHLRMRDGHLGKCKECTKLDSRERGLEKKDYIRAYDRERYRTNIERLKKWKYKGIVDRCKGRHKTRRYYVEGMTYLTWAEYERWWKLNEKDFRHCYTQWKKSGYKNKFAPSIDRIDSRKGYTPENMQWLVFTMNCKKYNK